MKAINRSIVALAAITLLGLFLAAGGQQMPDPSLSAGDVTPYSAGPLAEADMPNPRLTPGAVIPDLTVAQLCVPGYSGDARKDLTPKQTKALFASYGIMDWIPKRYQYVYEDDHLIPLELLGSNEIKNRWAESYLIVWNAHVKDKLENKLHAMVCVDHSVDLPTAQQWISTDWIATYKRVFATDNPLPLR